MSHGAAGHALLLAGNIFCEEDISLSDEAPCFVERTASLLKS